jgi:chorismate mutase
VRLQALRGATTCNEDSKAEIDAKTARLVKELFARNDLAPDDVVSIIFTATPDLTAEFPATAARAALGLDGIALLGAQEQAVAHGTPRCIRVLVHCYTERARDELRHVFLEGAAALRTDLARDDAR